MRAALIAGTHSGCGKTTVTLGILAALRKKGLKAQSFKAGPDFIDSGLHRVITGRHSRNLDMWMCGEDYVKDCFRKYSQDADVSIVEGVMGLYDGDFSTSRLAALIDIPVILVIDAYGMAESAGAVVKGFSEYNRNKLAGVIFNRVASERHYERLKNSVQDVRVLGYLPRDLSFEIPHRHLGLTVAEENPIAEENIERLADTVLKHVNIEAILVMNDYLPLHSRKASKPSSEEGDCPGFTGAAVESGLSPTSAIKIAVAYDKAFCFYYEDNFDLLKNAGAEIIKFSPISDSKIPDGVDAVYIGGGYPELYAKELSDNASMLASIKDWADAGRPIYAECGGLMYLSKGIHDFNGNFSKTADVFPFETQMKRGRAHLGYREIELKDNCILGRKGDSLRGHEFHYSEIKAGTQAEAEGTVPITPPCLPLSKGRLGGVSEVVESGLSPSIAEIYSIRNNHSEFVNTAGYKFKNTLASYVHIHFGSNLNTAKNFIDFIYKYPSP
ncbi:MAG: cobyrinate a,c-diamide synthase [Nitrospirae bacterium]|nr:cobyrinate a,c-diamide synthase [Nitrospirota bacterium]